MNDYENNQNPIEDNNNNNDTYSQWQESSFQPNSSPQPGPGIPPKKTNTLALLSMLAGIFSLITCCQPLFGFVLSIAGIVLAVLSKKGQPFSGFAIAGLVLSILGLIASIAICAYMVFVYSLLKDPVYSQLFNDILQEYYNAIP